jgi:hypothetical protein
VGGKKDNKKDIKINQNICHLRDLVDQKSKLALEKRNVQVTIPIKKLRCIRLTSAAIGSLDGPANVASVS